MVNASRKKLVIMLVVALAVAGVVGVAARPVHRAVCYTLLPPAEKKVVGEWKSYSIGGEIVTTFRPDHTWTSIGGCLKPDIPINGSWRVDGPDIVCSVDLPALDGEPPIKPIRMSIQQLIESDRTVRSWANRPTNK